MNYKIPLCHKISFKNVSAKRSLIKLGTGWVIYVKGSLQIVRILNRFCGMGLFIRDDLRLVFERQANVVQAAQQVVAPKGINLLS